MISFVIFDLFGVLFLILLYISFCDLVDDVPFEEGQEQQFEEESQQFDEEGKWPSPLHILFLSQ